jgi:hypothetical protein
VDDLARDDSTVGAVGASTVSIRMLLSLSVKITAPFDSERAQPSGTFTL